jgi:hypothetical protein
MLSVTRAAANAEHQQEALVVHAGMLEAWFTIDDRLVEAAVG